MKVPVSDFDLRRVYYDHEPFYIRRAKRNATGWDPKPQKGKFSRYWKIFKASGFLGKAPKGTKVLDLGCGGGEMAIRLARKGYRVTGVDYSETAIRMAKENAVRAGISNAKFYRRDALRSALPDSQFGLITSIDVLHCFIGRDRLQYWKEVRRMLSRGGFFALTCMVDFPHRVEIRKHISPSTRTDKKRMRYYATEARILGEARAAGLLVVYRARKWDADCDEYYVVASKL